MNILLDTNVLSEVRRPNPSPEVIRWLEQLDQNSAFISVVTFAEIRRGVSQLEPGHRRRALSMWLESDLMHRFAGRVLPIDVKIAFAWGDLMSESRRGGFVVAPLDGMIAATARVHQLAIATRNTADFDRLDLKLIDPWQP